MNGQWRRAWSADLRALALLRIGLGLLLAVDLALRSRELELYYTDAGAYPLSQKFTTWSIHAISGSFAWQAALFVVAGAFALCLAAGYRTRLCAVVSFVLLVSLHNRNPYVLQAGDVFLRCILFFAMFLPLGDRWSLDARLGRTSPSEGPSIFNAATVAYTCQILFVYLFTALLKSGEEWFPAGTAVHYALNARHLTTGLGAWLGTHESLLTPLTHSVLIFEYLGPLLLLSPWRNGPVRTATILAFLALQIGFGLSLGVGLFPYISCVVMLGLLPSWVFDRKEAEVPRWSAVFGLSGQPRIVVDGVVIASLLFVFVHNLGNIRSVPRWIAKLGAPARIVRLDQRWNMFAPHPPRSSEWYIPIGRRADQTEIDLGTMASPEEREPEDYSERYPSYRTRKFLSSLDSLLHPHVRRGFAQHLCEGLARLPEGQRPSEVELWKLEVSTPAPSATDADRRVERRALFRYNCTREEGRELDLLGVPTSTTSR